jgi:16S rRNA (guanine1207-N2)-methyltransferase
MSKERLELALQQAARSGVWLVLNPNADMDFADLGSAVSVSYDAISAATIAARGGQVVQTIPQTADQAVVFIPRAKPLAQAWIAAAMRATNGGPVLVDGQKTDGIDSLLKACKTRTQVTDVIAKSHGKAFWMQGSADDFADWAEPAPRAVGDGLQTRVGVFSADGIDPASALLASNLPDKLAGRVADLGAGWGYLSAALLHRSKITAIELVEADHRALECARSNITDTRAEFTWADVLTWSPKTPVDVVVMNPPFHTGRNADPDLGRGFITSAARALTPKGHLYMVANRHLPYEPTLEAAFAKVQMIGGDNRFKLIHASGPRLKRG